MLSVIAAQNRNTPAQILLFSYYFFILFYGPIIIIIIIIINQPLLPLHVLVVESNFVSGPHLSVSHMEGPLTKHSKQFAAHTAHQHALAAAALLVSAVLAANFGTRVGKNNVFKLKYCFYLFFLFGFMVILPSIDPTTSIGLPLRTPDCSMAFFLVFPF